MSVEFDLEAIIDGETITLIARTINVTEFKLHDKSTLNGCEIKSVLSQPRVLKPDGKQDIEVYCFSLVNTKDKDKFTIGTKIELL